MEYQDFIDMFGLMNRLGVCSFDNEYIIGNGTVCLLHQHIFGCDLYDVETEKIETEHPKGNFYQSRYADCYKCGYQWEIETQIEWDTINAHQRSGWRKLKNIIDRNWGVLAFGSWVMGIDFSKGYKHRIIHKNRIKKYRSTLKIKYSDLRNCSAGDDPLWIQGWDIWYAWLDISIERHRIKERPTL